MSLLNSFGAEFFQRAMAEAVIGGALAGAVGVHILLRRLQFFVVALSHATFPGVVIASALGFSLLAGGSAFGLVVAVLVAAVGRQRASDGTSAIGIVVAGAFALGVVLITALPAGSRQLSAFLIGSILTVNTSDVVSTAIVAALVLLALVLLHKELVFSAFDRTGAQAGGLPVGALDLFVLVLVTVVSVVLVPSVGTLLAIALLTVPALTARLWVERTVPMTVMSSILGAMSALAGLFASAIWSVAAGGAIALVATGLFAVSFVLRGIMNKPYVRRLLYT